MEEVCFNDMVQSSAWKDAYFRLQVIRDLIELVLVEESKGHFFGSFHPSNLYFLGKKVHLKQIHDVSSPDFQNLREKRKIRTYREELVRVVPIIIPRNSNLFKILDTREYSHFQRLLSLDLTVYELLTL